MTSEIETPVARPPASTVISSSRTGLKIEYGRAPSAAHAEFLLPLHQQIAEGPVDCDHRRRSTKTLAATGA